MNGTWNVLNKKQRYVPLSDFVYLEYLIVHDRTVMEIAVQSYNKVSDISRKHFDKRVLL
jgi:hypothetical protein